MITLAQLRPAIVSLALFTLLTGVVYPLLVTGLAAGLFPRQAAGSLILCDGRPVGSELIGQAFSDPRYFWGRPSATTPVPYTAFNADTLTGSSGSNLGPLHPALVERAAQRVAALRAADPQNHNPVPIDLVVSSASGLDPHISVAAALYQMPRVARARGVPPERVRELIDRCTVGRQLGVLGEPCVNVLRLNLALDEQTSGG